MTRTTQKVAGVFAFVAVVLVLVVAMLLLRNPTAALPNPNGYDDFVKAGQMVSWPLDIEGHSADYRELSLRDMRVFAATNADALNLVRNALQRQCRVPIHNGPDWFSAHLGEIANFKDLTRVFLIAGRLAQLEGRTNDAVSIYLDSIRFAQECNRGGMIIDTAIARVQEDLGMEGLKSVQQALNAQQCRRIAKVLEEVDARQESWSDYFRRDVRYALHSEPGSFFRLGSWRLRQHFKAKFEQAQLRRRQTLLAFAARGYELDTGTKPIRLTDLLPAYLKTFPQDPLTQTNLALLP